MSGTGEGAGEELDRGEKITLALKLLVEIAFELKSWRAQCAEGGGEL